MAAHPVIHLTSAPPGRSALTVAVAAHPVIHLTRSWLHHVLLTAAPVELGMSAVVSAIMPDYGTLVAARVLARLRHAASWATIGVYLGHVLWREHGSRSVGLSAFDGTRSVLGSAAPPG